MAAAFARRAMSTHAQVGPVAATIRSKLAQLEPRHIEILNESGNHNVPKGSETHFKVVIVSDAFDGKKLIDRHRMVNAILADELATTGPVHALSIVAKTPTQWEQNASFSPSPKCEGGSKA